MTIKNSKINKYYWKEYWTNFKPFRIDRVLFNDILEKFPYGARDFIEIGGFPGIYSIYLKKNKNYNVTLLDYYIDRNILNQMEVINDLPKNTVKIIEADFLEYMIDKRYDLVMSCGFVEHFNNLASILEKHICLLKNDGLLFVAIPNFLGINGWAQKFFDKKNYQAHNTKAMNLKYFKKILTDSKLENIKISYYGKPCVWLEESAPVNHLIRRLVRLISKLISLVNLKNRIFSPYIIILANKQD